MIPILRSAVELEDVVTTVPAGCTQEAPQYPADVSTPSTETIQSIYKPDVAICLSRPPARQRSETLVGAGDAEIDAPRLKLAMTTKKHILYGLYC